MLKKKNKNKNKNIQTMLEESKKKCNRVNKGGWKLANMRSNIMRVISLRPQVKQSVYLNDGHE